MASEKQNDGFRLSFDEEDEAEVNARQLQAELEDLKVEKLSQRVTIITILIPILIVVVLGVTYLDIKRRVISTETSGSKGFESLSRDLESRFSSLSLRQAKLEEDFEKESERLNETSAAMAVRIKKSDAALNALSAAAVSQKTLDKKASQTLTDVDDKIAPLAQQVASNQGQLTALNQDTAARLAELEGLLSAIDPVLADMRASLQALDAEVTPLSGEVQSLAAEKIGKEQLDLALKIDRLRIISDLQAEDKRLAQRLEEVSRQLTVVRGELIALENRLYPHQKRTLKPIPGAAPTPKPGADKPALKDGITEQDLN